MRVQTKPRHGNAVLWNGTNIEEARAVAGDSFVGLHSDHLLVRKPDLPGEVCWVRPGWWIIRWDGEDVINVFSGGAFTSSAEAEYQEAASAP